MIGGGGGRHFTKYCVVQNASFSKYDINARDAGATVGQGGPKVGEGHFY